MSEGQAISQKITPLGKAVKKSTTRHKQRIGDQSKNRNYPHLRAVVAVDNISQQMVSTRTKLVTSVVKLATKQHAVGTKEINLHTKKFKKPTMRKTNKTAHTVTGDKMKFEGELTLPVTLNGTIKKVKVCVHKQSENLVGTDWMERFKLWGQSINNFCHQRENSTTEAQEFKVELKENALPASKKKRNTTQDRMVRRRGSSTH